MTSRPIIFSADMVRAILEGRKTQTRRVVGAVGCDDIEPCPDYDGEWIPWRDGERLHSLTCPYGQPGDRLWVRETWRPEYVYDDDLNVRFPGVRYVAPGTLGKSCGGTKIVSDFDTEQWERFHARKQWIPSIHMPRWASRIDLEITAVRVERLQDVSGEDCSAEGVRPSDPDGSEVPGVTLSRPVAACATGMRSRFRHLWNRIHGPDAWDQNPWVWVIEFEKVKP